jgi:hypothetical protein
MLNSTHKDKHKDFTYSGKVTLASFFKSSPVVVFQTIAKYKNVKNNIISTYFVFV